MKEIVELFKVLSMWVVGVLGLIFLWKAGYRLIDLAIKALF
jgi:hypothetical protein